MRVRAASEKVGGDGAADGRRVRPGTRAVAVSVLAALAVPAAAFGWHASEASTVPVRRGDVVKVVGARIGCIVRRHSGESALDCRRIGPLAGSYGTILTSRRVLVVRFVDKDTAQVVFRARHRQLEVHRCG